MLELHSLGGIDCVSLGGSSVNDNVHDTLLRPYQLIPQLGKVQDAHPLAGI
jgi:hypothetical protein